MSFRTAYGQKEPAESPSLLAFTTRLDSLSRAPVSAAPSVEPLPADHTPGNLLGEVLPPRLWTLLESTSIRDYHWTARAARALNRAASRKQIPISNDDANLEGMRRSAPVLFTVPGQLYDGGGNGTWWLQEIDRPFDHWSVLARFNWGGKGAPETEVKFADLGLANDREYLVFEFWTQTFLGKSRGSFKAPVQNTNDALQVFAIREARAHPWVISTTRHISQGGVSLLDERWNAGSKTLSGKSAVVVGDPYVLTVHLPQGFQLKSAEVGGEKTEFANQMETATIRLVPPATRTVDWKMSFAK